MHKTKNDLPDNTRKASIGLLQSRLSDSVDMLMQAKQAHWNVKGPSFIALHELFDKVYTEMDGHVDEIAERLVALGGQAYGTIRHAANDSSLSEYPLDIAAGEDHVEALSSALAQYGKNIRSAIDEASEIGDEDTVDLFTSISRDIDKSLWFVEAHNQK